MTQTAGLTQHAGPESVSLKVYDDVTFNDVRTHIEKTY